VKHAWKTWSDHVNTGFRCVSLQESGKRGFLKMVSRTNDLGPMLWFFKYFRRKIQRTKLAFFTQNKAKLCKILIITLVFEKNANFFAENCRKSQKIVIITSTPAWGFRHDFKQYIHVDYISNVKYINCADLVLANTSGSGQSMYVT
jgi:hypothetical protein